ncbi:hypothetical protein H072_10855 [Dactylellina haptotyla CBS 200.50]|uniref:Uncharacterized protein n=1 Tax=Dactylellina haptotyla (strain CBS 200.50) TaxID=1284197 RepID=S7ZZ30_DACHA|nr:hypothetical protein H072_10855 [Dactylellina haptotyla CBS 200.50]
MSKENLTREQLRMLAQQKADLGDHRVSELPLGDRNPGGRGRGPSRPQLGRLEGPRDARLIFGPRPGGPPPRNQGNARPDSTAFSRQSSERKRELDPRWDALFDETLGIEREDGLGEGDLHRQGANFRPRRRRSFSSGPPEKPQLRDNVLQEKRVFSSYGGPPPSKFRKPGSQAFILGNRPVDKRLGERPFQPPDMHQHPRPPRGPASGNRSGVWSSQGGLVEDQDLFFNGMVQTGGLKPNAFKLPGQPRGPSGLNRATKPLAKPMPSAKDLTPEIRAAEVAKSKVSVGFIPPHLRHSMKNIKELVDDKATVSEPNILELDIPVQTPVEQPALIPTTPTSPPSPKSVLSKDDIEIAQNLSPEPIIGQASKEFARDFWQLIIKPLWGHLFNEYQNVPQQLVFLSSYYSSNVEEWAQIKENGTPSPEAIATLTRNYIAEDLRKEEEEKAKIRQIHETDDTWWTIDMPDEAIDEWADEWATKVQQSHRLALIEALKLRIREETDPKHTEILCQKINAFILANKRATRIENLVTQQSLADTDGGLVLMSIDREFNEPDARNAAPSRSGLFSDAEMSSAWDTFLKEFEEDDVKPLNKETEVMDLFENQQQEERGSRSLAMTSSSEQRVRETSDQRREREKQERIAQINKEWDINKAKVGGRATIRGMDGNQEFPMNPMDTDLDDVDKKSNFSSFDKDANIERIRSMELVEPQKRVLEDVLTKCEESTATGREITEIDPEQELQSNIAFLASITHPDIAPEQLEVIRARNRELFPELAINDPWKLVIRVPSNSPDEEPVVVHLDCTDNIPLDFIKELRLIVGAERWDEVINHPNFRKVVVDTTRGFYGMMARRWGPQFGYGLGDPGA